MRTMTLLYAAATCIALPALAQSPDGRPPMPMKPDFATALSISQERAAQVESVLLREREAMRKLREATRAELSQILTAEQIAKLEEMMPRGPRGGGPGGAPKR
jgi:hypothetical protein